MSDATAHLLDRARRAPIFILSPAYRDELAAAVSGLGWQVIAARRDSGVAERFLASGAIIAVLDLRRTADDDLAAVAALGEATEAMGAALVVIAAEGGHPQLRAALRAGATHAMIADESGETLTLTLLSAERHALRLLRFADPARLPADIWRDNQLTWVLEADAVTLSPALAQLLKTEAHTVPYDQFLRLFPRAAQTALSETIAQVHADQRPRALTHPLRMGGVQPVAHHLRQNPARAATQGLIELPAAFRGDEGRATRDAHSNVLAMTAARHWFDDTPRDDYQLFYLALQRFDIINQAFGRATGDAVLRGVSRRIDRVVRSFYPSDCVITRITGACFLIAVPPQPPQHDLLVDQLTALTDRPLIAEGHEVRLESVVGTAGRGAGRSFETIIKAIVADLAGAAGATGLHAAHDPRLAADLRAALDHDGIDILFQPQVDVSSGTIVGVEALARWAHPQHGTLGAETLFAVAAHSDYLTALSTHIQKRAIAVAASWPSALHRLRVAINVTAQDIARADFDRRFLAMLHEADFPTSRVTIEITESGLIDNLARAADLFSALRRAGCRVAIDDFGTGYSSLAYLKALPLDYLKLDKALAGDILGSARDQIVVRGAIDMARSLGLAVIAEGVETEAQRAALAAEGCNYYQGFLCAGPLSSTELVARLISG